MKWLLKGRALINQQGLSIDHVLFPPCAFSPPVCRVSDRGSSGIITNKYWFEYIGAVIALYYGYGFRNNWIFADCDLRELIDCSKGAADANRGAPGLAMGDVRGSISLFSMEGHIVKWARGVPRCMSQTVLSWALWWNFRVCGVWNNTACYLGCGIFIAAIIQTRAAPVCVYVYRGEDTAHEKLFTIVCT